MQEVKIKSIKKIKKQISVYDIEVEDAHHYILDNGVISHNSYVPTKVMGGGSGLQYSASSITMLSKAKDRDGKDVIGNLIKVRMDKSRNSKENTSVTLKLSYQTGLDKYFGLLELAEKYNIIKKITAQSYELPGGEKVKGKDLLSKSEKYFTKDILNEIEKAANKEFKYGNMGDERPSEREEDSDNDSDL